jgi:hypothetical protein
MRKIFVLTKREQRVVIVVMIILVTGALANHYREKWRDSATTSRSPAPNITPALLTSPRQDRERDEDPDFYRPGNPGMRP